MRLESGVLMYGFEEVMQKLKEDGIDVQLVEHEPAPTMEIADKVIEGIPGVRTKTVLMRNKKKTRFFMLIMDGSKRMDMSHFKDLVGDRQLKMASADDLQEKLGLQPGVVSPFGLLNNTDHDVEVFVDQEIANEERMSFHPNSNERTVFIKSPALYAFLKDLGYSIHFENL